MKMMTVTLLVTFGALAACGQKSETAITAAASGVAGQNGAMADEMARTAPTSQVGKMVKGTGIVTAVDAKAGTVMLDHDAIPAAGWPAMTMAFSAPADVIAQAKVGEKVIFDLRIEEKGGVIISIAAPPV